MRRLIQLMFAFAALLLVGCMNLPLRQRTLPTIGPVQSPSGVNAYVQIAASTNCAQVGEIITITARFKNREPYPITLVGTPPLDIVIRPSHWPQDKPRPTRRWSESDQYPGSSGGMLARGEERTYIWNRKAEVLNASEPGSWVTIDFVTGGYIDANGIQSQGGIENVGIGVNQMPIASEGSQGSVPCAELHRSV